MDPPAALYSSLSMSASSTSVAPRPRCFSTAPSSVDVMLPLPSLSKTRNASLRWRSVAGGSAGAPLGTLSFSMSTLARTAW